MLSSRPSEQVVRQRGQHGPSAVGVEIPGGEVRQCLILKVCDDLLDNGVLAVLGLHEGDVGGPWGPLRSPSRAPGFPLADDPVSGGRGEDSRASARRR